MNQHEIQTESVEGLIAIRANIDRELASRKATLQKQLAQLGGIRPTRAPRSDKGQKRKQALLSEDQVIQESPHTAKFLMED